MLKNATACYGACKRLHQSLKAAAMAHASNCIFFHGFRYLYCFILKEFSML